MSPVERARQALTGAGFSVFRSGEAVGPCRAAYLVVSDGGADRLSAAGARRVVGVTALAPLGRPEELSPLIAGATAALAPIGLKPRGTAQPEVIDEAFRAHAQSIEFTALCAV